MASRETLRVVNLAPPVDNLPAFEGLRPVQRVALARIKAANGGLIAAGVGHGKFLISVLAPTVLNSRRALLLVPNALIEQTHQEIKRWREVYPIIEGLRVEPYSILSSKGGRRLLLDYNPDLVVADEAHALRRRESTRTKRLIEFYRANPRARFVALSGTLTARALRDFDHLAELALRDLSPLPRSYRAIRSWSACIDVTPVEPPTAVDYREIAPLREWSGGLPAREAFRARFKSAEGVISTETSAYEGSLIFKPVRYDLAPAQVAALDKLEDLWRAPDGRDLENHLDLARVRRQILTGYYTRWNPQPDPRWLAARSRWLQAARQYLIANRQGLDSLGLIADAAERGGCSPIVRAAWTDWAPVRHLPPPPVEAVWLTTHVIEQAEALARELDPAILWSESPFILEQLTIPCYGAGIEPPTAPEAVALSRRAHGTGRNLQHFSRNITIGLPPSAAVFEQLIGRTHRPGQQADVVELHYLTAEKTPREIKSLRRDARYLEQTTGQKTKINCGLWLTS